MKQLTLILLLIVAFGSCKKNTVDFKKSSEASQTKSNQIKTLYEDKKKQLEALMKR